MYVHKDSVRKLFCLRQSRVVIRIIKIKRALKFEFQNSRRVRYIIILIDTSLNEMRFENFFNFLTKLLYLNKNRIEILFCIDDITIVEIHFNIFLRLSFIYVIINNNNMFITVCL